MLGEDNQTSEDDPLEIALWDAQVEDAQEAIDAQFEGGMQLESPFLVEWGTIAEVRVAADIKSEFVEFDAGDSKWGEPGKKYRYFGSRVSLSQLQDSAASLRTEIASGNGELTFAVSCVLGWLPLAADDNSNRSFTSYSWYWWPTKYGKFSLAGLCSRALSEDSISNSATRKAFVDSGKLAIVAKQMDLKPDSTRLADLSDLVWWRLGNWIGVSRDPLSVHVLLLIPGLTFTYRHLSCTVQAADSTKLVLEVRTLQPNERLYGAKPDDHKEGD